MVALTSDSFKFKPKKTARNSNIETLIDPLWDYFPFDLDMDIVEDLALSKEFELKKAGNGV